MAAISIRSVDVVFGDRIEQSLALLDDKRSLKLPVMLWA